MAFMNVVAVNVLVDTIRCTCAFIFLEVRSLEHTVSKDFNSCVLTDSVTLTKKKAD